MVLQAVDNLGVQQLLQLPVVITCLVDGAQHTQRVLDGPEGVLVQQDLATVCHLRHTVYRQTEKETQECVHV